MSNIRNMKDFETYKINFNDKDDYNYYVNKLGGAEKLANYSHIAEAIQAAANVSEQRQTSDKSNGQSALEDEKYIAYAYYDNNAGKLSYACVISLTANVRVCDIQIDIYDENEIQLAKKYITYKNQSYMVVKDTVSVAKSKFINKKFSVHMLVSTLGKGASALGADITQATFFIDDIVKSTDILHPIKKYNEDKPIYVFYGRLPTSTDRKKVDYVYNEALLPTGNAKMMLDMMGSAVFTDGSNKFTEAEIDEVRAFMDFGRGVVRYNNNDGSKINLVAEKFGLGWYFDNYWGVTLSKNTFNASNISNLTVMLRYKTQGTGDNVNTIFLSSHLDEDLSESCRKIRQFDLKIGCFAAGTRILMADGSLKNIEDIKIGDILLSGKTKTPAGVTNTFKGKATQLIIIETEGATLKVTPEHLIATDEGLCEAGKLNAGMKVYSSDGGYVPIKFLYDAECGETVYNLALDCPEGQGTLYAEGILVGDAYARRLQQRAVLEADDVAEKLYEEFVALDKSI